MFKGKEVISDIRENEELSRIALFVKENAHFSRSLGGVFFLVCLVIGEFWVAGKDVEAVAYVFGLLSSIFLALPSIAEYVVPNRKPIRDMSSRELIEFLGGTSTEHWRRFETNWAWEAYLDEDPRLRLTCRYDDYGKHCDNFAEEWATKVSHDPVQSYYYDFVYDRALIERFILVAVDGNRALIPLPKSRAVLKITQLQYVIGEIANKKTEDFVDYLGRTGVQVEYT